jgi:insulysin
VDIAREFNPLSIRGGNIGFSTNSYLSLRKFDPLKIEEGLKCLRPDNFTMTVVSQKLPGVWKQKEKWYGTEYTYEKIPADFLAEIRQAAKSTLKNRLIELHLPHENQFIPTKLEVEKKEIKEPALSPKLIRNNELVRNWFKKDDQFWVPKANLFVNCRNTLPNATAENGLKARLYTHMVRDALEEYSYYAELAGLEYSISAHSMGIEITVSGYNDKLSVLLEKVLVTMGNLEIKENRFEIIKERVLRGLKNWDFQQPYNQVVNYTRWLNAENGYANEQILAELHHLNAVDVQQFYPHLLRQMHIETFVHGNLYKEDALKLSDLIESLLKPRPLPQTQWHIARQLIFPPGSNFVFQKTLKDPANVNHCIEYLLYVGDKSIRSLHAKTLLLDQMTHEPAFDQLRTKEQLGYVVFTGARPTSTTIGFRFIIQSEKTPQYLESRIDNFLCSWAETLEQMSDAEFEGHKRSLITKRLEKLKNLDQESGRCGHTLTASTLILSSVSRFIYIVLFWLIAPCSSPRRCKRQGAHQGRYDRVLSKLHSPLLASAIEAGHSHEGPVTTQLGHIYCHGSRGQGSQSPRSQRGSHGRGGRRGGKRGKSRCGGQRHDALHHHRCPAIQVHAPGQRRPPARQAHQRVRGPGLGPMTSAHRQARV